MVHKAHHDVRVEVKVRNNLILSQMELCGIRSLAELARIAGVGYQHLTRLVRMEISAKRKSQQGTYVWRDFVVSIATALHSDPESLFSDAQSFGQLEDSRRTFTVSSEEYLSLEDLRGSTLQLIESNELQMARQALSTQVRLACAALTPRQQLVIVHRHGLNGYPKLTLQQVGAILKITGQRVRQIQIAAERKLRRARRLSLALDDVQQL